MHDDDPRTRERGAPRTRRRSDPRPSVVNLDLVESVPVATLVERLGRLSNKRMEQIGRALEVPTGCEGPVVADGRSRYVLLVQRRVKRKRGFTRLSPKRQITLPLAVVERAGLTVGEELAVEADDEGRVIVSRSSEEGIGERRRRALGRAAGALPGIWPAGALDRLRDEWR